MRNNNKKKNFDLVVWEPTAGQTPGPVDLHLIVNFYGTFPGDRKHADPVTSSTPPRHDPRYHQLFHQLVLWVVSSGIDGPIKIVAIYKTALRIKQMHYLNRVSTAPKDRVCAIMSLFSVFVGSTKGCKMVKGFRGIGLGMAYYESNKYDHQHC